MAVRGDSPSSHLWLANGNRVIHRSNLRRSHSDHFHSLTLKWTKYSQSYDWFIDQINTGSLFSCQIKAVWTCRHLNPNADNWICPHRTWFRSEDLEMSPNQQKASAKNTRDVWTDENWNCSIQKSIIHINLVNLTVWMFSGLTLSNLRLQERPSWVCMIQNECKNEWSLVGTYLRAGRCSSCPTC